MQVRKKRALGFAAAVAVVGVTLAGCSGATTPEDTAAAVDPDAEVTITVGEMPTADQAASLDTFNERVKDFEKLYPNITVKGEETRYDPSSFNALLVGGTAPTTLAIPFTDMQALIERGQAADITDYTSDSKVLSELNPELASAVTADDRQYGIVRQAYSMALTYNRALYEEAGLDPDSPPADWEGVLENAKIITEKTGKTGFIIPTTENTGGWLLTTMSYSNGSLVQEVDGDKVKVTIDTDGMKKSLQLLHDVRWDAGAAGANFLLSGDDIRNEFAGGSVGQTINGSLYADLVVNRGMSGEDIGIAPMPQGAKGLGALGGGAIQWFNPKATANEIAAALKWTEFYWLNKYVDEDAAVTLFSAQAADGKPVGAPEVPIVSAEAYEKFLGWIDEYINVDRSNYEAYLTSDLPIVAEPSIKAQETYAALDPIVQAVLTDENADIDKLLADAQTAVQALVDAG
ncbi:multiple sugar transport system substrate-binding protein [Microbacterium natoriense]|uniref:Multiple sugar transport system substrate-binding protein n=1 Tax=Microbacterium natoriense TaxID=284570 RepID=A0AAW8ETG8_9MICO|nr:extracellular solute-binding protein [Microbacterium natoriense]MDQ0646523.1 multiple sugar transport system substrate-binding protein [Microbacterium natoriense]